MPIYEYVCQDCGKDIEKLQKLSDEPLTDCPACGQPALKRKVSAAGFRLSGGGWYETDFKSKGQRNLTGKTENTSASGGGQKGEASAGAKSDAPASSAKNETTKPAAKPKSAGHSD
ncbi:MAG: FmdB family transcriptional regulator [Xanthomonadales bacterium]|nr:FmdB family transcriptional regulator [Xanthomonadales bacterium]|tara:strand:+ start:1567 stop:1914 length:348 start_codon:yes stop_codon:yes gene_type:complete